MSEALFCVLLWCGAGCIRGQDDGIELYTRLGLLPSASTEDIRKAWRRLSLLNHPDKLAQRGAKVTNEDQAEFAAITEAHAILSNPDRRRVYDSLGLNGLKWSENPSSIDPQVNLSSW